MLTLFIKFNIIAIAIQKDKCYFIMGQKVMGMHLCIFHDDKKRD